MHGKMPSFTIIRLAKAGMGGDDEALNDFVLEAPSDYLDNFASPEDAMKALLEEEEMEGAVESSEEGDLDVDAFVGKMKEAIKMLKVGADFDSDALKGLLSSMMEQLGEMGEE